MAIERSFFRTIKELRTLQSQRLSGGEASVLHCNSENSKNEQNKANSVQSKPQIPPFDPMKLLENMKTNPIGLDPLTKIMMKSDRDRQLTKKAM